VAHESPGFLVLVRRGALRRCPVCARGRIFASLLRLRRSCPACGWVIEREPGAVTGSMYLIAVLSELFAAFLLVLIWSFTDWSPVTALAVGLPLMILFSLVALPIARGIWVAVEYHTDVRSGETGRADYDRTAYRRDGE